MLSDLDRSAPVQVHVIPEVPEDSNQTNRVLVSIIQFYSLHPALN